MCWAAGGRCSKAGCSGVRACRPLAVFGRSLTAAGVQHEDDDAVMVAAVHDEEDNGFDFGAFSGASSGQVGLLGSL